MAQVRFVNGSAHLTNRSVCCLVARTVTVPSSHSSQPMATAVCVALCGSIPMMTVIEYLLVRRFRNRQGTPDSDRGARSSFEPLDGKDLVGSSSIGHPAA